MSRLVHPPVGAVREVVARALAEDLLPLGDVTASLVDPTARAGVALVSRAPGVLAGRLGAAETFAQVDPSLEVTWLLDDGEGLAAGSVIATVVGALSSVVTAERTALNLLCHLSGVATLTRRYVDAVAGSGARILDTRKTTPGLRALEKAAVRAGGGLNHRGNLSDMVLVKDNHLGGTSIAEAVARARELWPMRTVEVECDSMGQLREAMAAGVGAVLLDNMGPADVAVAVQEVGGRAVVEVSGGLGLDNVAAFAATGADLLSVGALTHSAPALDVGLDLRS